MLRARRQKKPRQREDCCSTCRYFDLTVFEKGDTYSWCLRYPPVYVGPDNDWDGEIDDTHQLGYWEQPTVGIGGWCGEYEPRS